MKTQVKTNGFGGGYTNAATVRSGCRTTDVLLSFDESHHGVACRKEDARQQRQLRTGAPNCSQQLTDDSLTHLPRLARVSLLAVAALTLTGIIPMALCAALIAICDVIGYWPLIPMFAAVLCALWRVVMS